MRRLYLILGDQLDRDSLILNDVDIENDCFWMAEVNQESTHVRSHKQLIALFLSGMRHFAQELRDKVLPLQYHFLQDEQFSDLAEALAHTINIQQPEEVWFVRPSDYRVFERLVNTRKLLLCLMEEKILKSVIDKSL